MLKNKRVLNVKFHEIEDNYKYTGYTEYITKIYISDEIFQFYFSSAEEEVKFLNDLLFTLGFTRIGYNEYYKKNERGKGILVRREKELYKVYLVKYKVLRKVPTSVTMYFNINIEKLRKNANKIMFNEVKLAEIVKRTELKPEMKVKKSMYIDTPIYVLIKRASELSGKSFSYVLNVLFILDEIDK